MPAPARCWRGSRCCSSGWPRRGCSARTASGTLPLLPDVVGVVTSPSGAVLHDIQTTIARRFPRPVLLWPVPVQGEGAAAQIAAAIAGFDRLPRERPAARGRTC